MKITFYGHACFSIKTDKVNLLFDPFITGNPLASHIDVDSIEADYILLSHAHQDHVLDALSIAQRTGATIISNYEIVTHYANQGHDKGHPMNHGGAWNFDFGRVKYTNAVHTSSFADGSYGGNPGGFVVDLVDGKTFYYSGDTALTYDMKLIADEFDLDFAVLPIGDNFTMGVDDAIRASDFIGGVTDIIGIHYDTFGYIKIDHAQAKEKFASARKNLHLLEIGGSIDF